MRKLKGILVLVLLLALLASPIAVLASDISGARYYGTIIVSNSSTANTNVAVNCSISTQALIDGDYLNSSANNCAVRSSAGADVAFMPAVSDNHPWCIWVPSIGQDASTADILYTAESTGGKIRYFPAAGGMTSSDNANMELGDNFTVEQKGWVDTSYTIADFTTYTEVDANAKLTVTATRATAADADRDEDVYLYTDMTADYFDHLNVDFEILIEATSVNDANCGVAITNTVNSTSGFAATDIYASAVKTGGVYKIFLYRGAGVASDSFAALADTNYYCTLVRGAGSGTVNLLIYTNSTRTALTDTLAVAGFGTTKYQYVYGFVNWNIPSAGLNFDGYVQNLAPNVGVLAHKQGAFRTFINGSGNITSFIGTTPSVTASGVSSGEYSVATVADTTNLRIDIGGVTQDTIAVGAGVPDNSANWTFLLNNVMPYMEYQEITIDGVLQQKILWELDTVFSDLSGNSHDATPTFRTTSSDPDVSAVFTSFLPVSEAQAPSYALEDAPAFIETVPTIVSEWDVVPPAGTFPLAGVIAAIAGATDTPAQLPLLIIAVFVMLAFSLTVSATMRRYGSGSLIPKIIAITAIMGIFIAIGNFGIDFWMLFVFLVIAIALSMGSKQIGWQ